jgi:hypothetical protein
VAPLQLPVGSADSSLRLQEEQFAVFATANVGLIHVISCLNDLYRVLVALVGEQELEGFDRAQARWARHEVGAEL